MNKTRQKQTHRHRELIGGYQGDEGWEVSKMGEVSCIVITDYFVVCADVKL